MYIDRARWVETRKQHPLHQPHANIVSNHTSETVKLFFGDYFFHDIGKSANVSNDCEMFKYLKLNILVTFSLPALQRVHVRLWTLKEHRSILSEWMKDHCRGNAPQLPEGDGSLLSAAPGGNIQTVRR